MCLKFEKPKLLIEEDARSNSSQISTVNEFKHILKLNYATIIGITDQNYYNMDQVKDIDHGREKNINVFPLIYSLLELTKEKYTLDNENFQKFNFDKLQKLTTKLIESKNGNSEEVVRHLRDNYFPNDHGEYKLWELLTSSSQYNEIHSCTLISKIKFANAMSTTYNKIMYNRIEGSCEILTTPDLPMSNVLFTSNWRWAKFTTNYTNE